jgi:hypothetical protein
MAHILKLRSISFEKCEVLTLSADFVWNILHAFNNFKMSGKSHVWINDAVARDFFLISSS